jgi:hypothetical protein
MIDESLSIDELKVLEDAYAANAAMFDRFCALHQITAYEANVVYTLCVQFKVPFVTHAGQILKMWRDNALVVQGSKGERLYLGASATVH